MSWPILAYVPAAMALAHVRRRIGFPRPVMIPLASAVPLAVSEALPRSKGRYAAIWAAYLWLFKVACELPYDQPDKLGRRLRVESTVRIDSRLAGGQPLTLRLQRALRDPPRLTPLDVAATGLYVALWPVPHLVLAWILLRHEEHFVKTAGRLAAVYHLTTVVYWMRPSAPPWWASERDGEMGGEVQHVVREVGHAVKERLRPSRASGGDGNGGGEAAAEGPTEGNPWAAMPSDYLAAAAATAMCMRELSPTAGAVGWAYVGVVGFTVVYLGEHYVADLIVALALAEGVRRVEPAVVPLLRGALAALRGLEQAALGRST